MSFCARPILENIVVVYQFSSKINQELSVARLAESFIVTFDRRKHPCIFIRLQSGGKITAFINNLGRCVVTGITTRPAADTMIATILPRIVADQNTPLVVTNTYVLSVTAKAELGAPINISALLNTPAAFRVQGHRFLKQAVQLSSGPSDSEPYRCAVIFQSGSVILVGRMTEPELHAWYSRVVNFVMQFANILDENGQLLSGVGPLPHENGIYATTDMNNDVSVIDDVLIE